MCSALFAPYGESLGRSLRKAERIIERCPHDFSNHSQNTVSTTLSRLRSRGLVSRRGPPKKTIWSLTAKGKSHFQDTKAENTLPSEDGKIRLVVYDIPENMFAQRAWLRNRLSAYKYSQLQRSVWLGKRPLPRKLRNELKERKLLPHIHVVGLGGFIDDSAED